VAAAFNPARFDAAQWCRTARSAGMGYLIITAKHHDGFAMYDSPVSAYDVVDATAWKRDPMRELADACRAAGVRFGFYYSHAFDWGEASGAGNDWDYQNPGGDHLLHGGTEWWRKSPGLLPRIRGYVDGKAIPQLRELVTQYDPDILWFDTPHKLPPEENLRILRAVREAKPSVVVNGRIVQPVPGGPRARFGDYASTADRPAEFPPHDGDWEAIPTTNESYGWHQADRSHKRPEVFIQMLAKAVARGGNVLLNIGPMGDGRFDPADMAILNSVGDWMKVNGEAIHGCGRTPLAVQAWGESTRKQGTLYLHVFRWPGGGKLLVGGLLSRVRRAFLLSDPRRTPLEVARTGDRDLVIDVPARAPDPANSVVALELDGEPAVDPARVLDGAAGSDTWRAFDAELRGGGLTFGAGKTRDAWVQGLCRAGQAVRWPARLRQPARFDVAVSYDAQPASAGGTFVVRLGATSLAGTVSPGAQQTVALGRVALDAGALEIAVEPTRVAGGELMRLRGLVFTPVREP
jgi:alpha-L-fucosidase